MNNVNNYLKSAEQAIQVAASTLNDGEIARQIALAQAFAIMALAAATRDA